MYAPLPYKFIYMFGMGADVSGSRGKHVVVDYGTKGFSKNLSDALKNIYKRGRVSSRTRRLMIAIQQTIDDGDLPVVIANSHGGVVTANALRALAHAGYNLDRVSVYALSPPRMVPWKTPKYQLRDSVNVIHSDDHLLPYYRKMGWWGRAFDGAKNVIRLFRRNDKTYKVLVTDATVQCRNVHVCLPLLQMVMPHDVAYAFGIALSRGQY